MILANFVTYLIHDMDLKGLFSWMVFSSCFIIDQVIGIFEWHFGEVVVGSQFANQNNEHKLQFFEKW